MVRNYYLLQILLLLLLIIIIRFQFDLVCDKAIYGTVSSSLIFVGWIVGALIAGVLADKFGRKIIVFFFGFFIGVFSLLSAFPNVYWLFALFRFLVGLAIGEYLFPIFALGTLTPY